MEINKQVLDILSENGINRADGLAYLLSVYFDTIPQYVPDDVFTSVNALKFFEVDLEKSKIDWIIPLFVEKQLLSEEWITEYYNKFKSANKEKRGSLMECKNRFKDFFRDNPDVTVDEVLEATDKYIRSTNHKFIRESQYFIWKQTGTSRKKEDRTSDLLMWVQNIREQRKDEEEYNNVI